MDVLGYFAAGLIGLSLGLIGGGGSVLTVPVLVYLFRIQPTLATSYSLFIVGAASLVGAYTNYRKGLLDIRTALLFGLSSITTVFIIRKFIIPVIPKTFAIGGVIVTEGFLTMLLFAVLMLLAAISMIRDKSDSEMTAGSGRSINLPKLLLLGIGIGIVTGLLGAGGGFLLIPALVLLVGLPMKRAIGTSLLIIALNSLIGFTGDLGHFIMDWRLLVTITVIAVTGILAGGFLAKRIPGEKLKTGFGWFVLFMGVYIIAREIYTK